MPHDYTLVALLMVGRCAALIKQVGLQVALGARLLGRHLTVHIPLQRHAHVLMMMVYFVINHIV